MKPFEHTDAKTIDEATGLLKDHRSKLIAGGTDLLGVLKDRVLPDYPELLINIKSIPGLDGIEADGGGLKIGALAKLADIAASPAVKKDFPLLAEAAASVGSPQVRNMGTIGGNLAQETRCWYYRFPHEIGGRILCYLKGGKGCYALTGDNRYHSIFGGMRETNPPCSSACPTGVDIPSYLSLIREGDLAAAAGILLQSNPLPAITGRVCPHFCEQECNRGDFDESVSVRGLERFIGDYILAHAEAIVKPAKTKSGKRVAVVGSGPAGLTAAYYLAQAGHSVTVFEALPEAGGMLRVAIPDYRLPKNIVDAGIGQIKRAGVEIKTGTRIDSVDRLSQEGYDAVFLALGAQGSTKLGIKGEESATVRDGLGFLMDLNLGKKVDPGKKVAVIGGGDVAIDSARTALRLGADEVTIVYRRTRAEMPATPETVQEAIDEGVKLTFLSSPVSIEEKNGQLKLTCHRMALGEPDASGRPRPVVIEGSQFSEDFDSIITAIGQTPDIPAQFGFKTGTGNTLPADADSLATTQKGVWAGGDAVTGPATVVEAIAAGRKAAAAIDSYLKGGKAAEPKETTVKPLLTFNSACLQETGRAQAPKLPVATRSLTAEDSPGLAKSDIEAEANRCFNCSCVSANSADMGTALVALDAKLKVTGPDGARTIPASDLFGSLGTTLAADEMITEIQIPHPPAGAKQSFFKYRVREAVDFAIVSLAAIITEKGGKCQDARLVLGSVAPMPLRAVKAEQALKGKSLDDKTINAAAEAAVSGAIPLKNNAYKVEIVKTLVKRALAP